MLPSFACRVRYAAWLWRRSDRGADMASTAEQNPESGRRRSFATALGFLTGPALIGAALSFLATPLLVLWFPPAQFGEVGTALAQASILAGLATLRIDMILYRPERAAERKALARRGVWLTLGISTLLLVLLYPLSMPLGMGSDPMMALSVYALTVALGIANVGTAYLVGQAHYLGSALPRIVTPLVMLGVAALLHFGGWGGGHALLFANVAGAVASALLYVASLAGTPTPMVQGVGDFLRQERRYMASAVPQSVVGAASFLNLFLMMVAAGYGVAAAGQLFLAYRIVGFPSTVLGMSAGHLIAAHERDLRQRGMGRAMLAMTGYALAIYLPLGAVAWYFPREWIPAQWTDSLAVAMPVILLCAAQFAIGSFGQLLLVWNRARAFLIWDLVRLAVTCGAALACWAQGLDYLAATWAFVIAHFAGYAVLAAMVLRPPARVA